MYVIVWRYSVPTRCEREFRSAYAPDGDWTVLFSRSRGFIGSELIPLDERGRFITIDRWASEADFSDFMAHHGDEYRRLDRRFESLADAEELIGRGSTVVQRDADRSDRVPDIGGAGGAEQEHRRPDILEP
jgi:heme-degrading monooxygenase HmoA